MDNQKNFFFTFLVFKNNYMLSMHLVSPSPPLDTCYLIGNLTLDPESPYGVFD